MFKQAPPPRQDRVLIASSDADSRRRLSDIVKAAEFRAVGFIREADQVIPRTLLSMPDVLLVDDGIFQQLSQDRSSLANLHSAGSLKIVWCGHEAEWHHKPPSKRDGLEAIFELNISSRSGDDPVQQFQKLFEARMTITSTQLPAPPRSACTQPAAAKRITLAPSGVVIGSSTGGPMALMAVLKALPANFPLPVGVVQHMPPGFTRMLAERLHAECAMRVVEAESGMTFEPGTVYIAPGGVHMVLTGSAKSPILSLNTQPPENSCRPAVDVLFRSSASVYGGRQHAIVLTGMGRDGLIGATHLHGLSARIVVQDAATSTVWGMPGAIAQAGFADDILPLHEIAPHLLRCL